MLLAGSGCASFWKNDYQNFRDRFEEVCTKGIGKSPAEVTKDFGQPYSDKRITCGASPCEEVEYWMNSYGGSRVRLIFATTDNKWKLVTCYSKIGDAEWTRYPFQPG
jgi:hypothetical protein